MKRLFYFLPVIVFGLLSCQKEEIANHSNIGTESFIAPTVKSAAVSVTKEDAINVADSLYGSLNTNIYISKELVQPSDTLLSNIIQQIISPAYTSWLVIVDLHPLANWSHECTYLYINVNTGEIETEQQYMLPGKESFIETIKEYKSGKQEQALMYDFGKMPRVASSGHARSANNKWAVIISGGGNQSTNHKRYWNDCSAIFNVLTSYYGYSGNNIFVLMSDGTSPGADMSDGTSSVTDLNGDGTTDIDYAATTANINTVFNTLGANVQSGDDVFIYVMDHGDIDNNNVAYICLWNNTMISQSSFAAQVNKITTNAHVHIVMGQCFSGGFVSSFANRNNTTIATACTATEASWSCYENNNYDEFVYHWTAAVYGQYPNGSIADADYDNDNNVSMLEAFRFAEENDYWRTHYTGNSVYPYEHPQYNSRPALFGFNHGLNGKLFESPSITGPTDVRINETGVYKLLNLPSSATVTWHFSDILNSSSTSNTIKNISISDKSRIYTDLQVSATINVMGISTTLQISGITYWKQGVSFVDDMMTGTIYSYGGYVSLIKDFEGAYGYQWSSDNGFTAEYQGTYHTNFTRLQRADPPESTYISVDFYNPFGEQTTIVQSFIIQ